MKHFKPEEVPDKVALWRNKAGRANNFITEKGLWQEYQKWINQQSFEKEKNESDQTR